MPEVDPDDILTLTARDDDAEVAALTVPLITTMAKAYTRGHGFNGNEPNEEIAAVITTASARFATNAGQLAYDRAQGPFSKSIRGAFQGWTLAETFV